MGDPRRGLGRLGEELAVRKLEDAGYRIIERNWRCSAGEIDIVAFHRGELVFVEVRARRGSDPEESMTPQKRARLVELGYRYMAEHGLDDEGWRIDFVAVGLSERGVLERIDIWENAVDEW